MVRVQECSRGDLMEFCRENYVRHSHMNEIDACGVAIAVNWTTFGEDKGLHSYWEVIGRKKMCGLSTRDFDSACKLAELLDDMDLQANMSGVSKHGHEYVVLHATKDDGPSPDLQYSYWKLEDLLDDEDHKPETVTPPELPNEDLEELDRIFPPDETITDTLPRSVWSMYAETYNVLGVYDVPATLDVLVRMDDNANCKRCLRFECDGVRLRRVGLYPRANLVEYSWTVDRRTDFVKLAAFMQKMSGYGCSVSLMTTKGRDE